MGGNPWDIDRFKLYLNTEESNVLDFKSSKALSRSTNDQEKFINDLTSHVSAFLNSEGGKILIGLEEAERRNLPDIATGLSDGVPRKQMNASNLEQKLCERIHPSVANYVRVFPVVVGKYSDGDLLAYVVEIKAGITAYQAKDKLYYTRRNYSSEAMDDKDIRLRMLSGDKPRANLIAQTIHGIGSVYHVDLSIDNVGNQTIREYSVKYRMVLNNYTEKLFQNDRLTASLQLPIDWKMFYVRHDNEGHDQEPLFPGARKLLQPFHLSVPEGAEPNQFMVDLEVELYIDNGQPVINRFEIGKDMLQQLGGRS